MPEVPALSGVVETLFAADGPLAHALPAFEPRAGQVDMAAAVARAFEQGGVLLAEAGTGTGKTLAYLVPAILSRDRVLISTGTEESSGADLLQGHSRAARGARRAVHGHLHEGAGELSCACTSSIG